MKQKVLIVQRGLRAYRTALFNALGNLPKVDLTVSTFNEPERVSDITYKYVLIRSKKTGPFEVSSDIASLIDQHDLAVIPFDLHMGVALKILVDSQLAKKTILWGHSHGRNKYFRLIRRKLIDKAQATVLYTDYGKQKLINEGANPEKLFVARNTIEVKNAEFVRDLEKFSFIFVGRLKERKKVDELLRAFAIAKHQLATETKIEIVGEGEEKKALKKLAKELHISDRVVFHGKVLDDEKLKVIFSRAIAYVSPNHVGLGVVHSFAYGVPVVTIDHKHHAPEFHYLEDGETGILYSGGARNLAEILIRIERENKISLRMGENAFSYFSENLALSSFTSGFDKAFDYSLNH